MANYENATTTFYKKAGKGMRVINKHDGEIKGIGESEMKKAIKMRKTIAIILCSVFVVAALSACGITVQPPIADTAYIDTPTPAPSTPSTVSVDDIIVGDIIEFGGIFWRVLDVQDGKMLIISEDILESRPYHEPGGDITWEHSTLRDYLNGEFYNGFDLSDRVRITETAVINNDNLSYDTPGGNDTTDKIFLLSIDEARAYFADNSARVAYGADGGSSRWWLRSPGYISYSAAIVRNDGSIFDGIYNYGNNVYNINYGVRPAMWLNAD